jgi:hypothetical protein
MIVGHKIERYFTVQRRWAPDSHWQVITHDRVTELHATKGWRVIRHDQNVQHVRRLRRFAGSTRFVRCREPKHVTQGTSWLDSVSPAVRERAINRHKVRRVEIQRANNRAAIERSHAQ